MASSIETENITSSYVAAPENNDLTKNHLSIDNNNNNDSAVAEQIKIAKLGIVANSGFFVGPLCFLMAAIWEERRLNDSAPIYTAMYVVGVLAYLLNAGTEVYTDTAHDRTEAHGRYVTSMLWNMMIGFLFACAAIVEMIGMFLWDDENKKPALTAWSISAWLWLISAAMTVWARPPSYACLNNVSQCFYTTDGLDNTANVMFLVGALIDVVISFMQEPNGRGPYEDEQFLLRANVVSSVAWFVDGFFYLLADYIRCQELKGDMNNHIVLSKKSGTMALL